MLNDPKIGKNTDLETSMLGKEQPKKRFWSCFPLMFCCPPQDEHDQTKDSPKKRDNQSIAVRSTNHYTTTDPNNSFLTNTLRQRNTISRIFANNSTFLYPKDTAFILRKGSKRIVSKIMKFNLDKIISHEHCDRTESDYRGGKSSIAGIGDNQTSSLAYGDTYDCTRQEVFSVYNRGIQSCKDDWREMASECVGQHIAKKLEGKFIIDALCGYGINTIQFAKYSPCVIGVEINVHKLKKAKHNANVYNIGEAIEFVNANFFAMRKLKADVVFLAPSELPVEKNQKFSLENHLTPSLPQLIRHSLKLASSICIKLPPHACIDELAAIFSDIYNENPGDYDNLNYTLEIDLLSIEESLASIVVFFGGNNQIDAKEQRDLIYGIIRKSEIRDSQESYTESAVHQLLEYIGLYRSLNMISNIEENLANQPQHEESIINIFLSQLFDKGLLSKEILMQLQKEQYDSAANSSEKNSKSGQSFGLALLGTEKSPTLQDPPELETLPFIKKLTGINSSQNSPKFAGPELSFGLEVEKTDSNLRRSHEKNASTKAVPLNLTSREARNTSILSIETSEMALSNYSLKSDAMLDSYSENYGEYILSVDDEPEGNAEVRSPRGMLRKTQTQTLNEIKTQRYSLVEPCREKSPKSNKLRVSQGGWTVKKSKHSLVPKGKNV